VKHRRDVTLELLRGANPSPEDSTTGWHETDEGRAVAAQARARTDAPESPAARTKRSTLTTSRRRHRLVVALAVIVALTFAVAAAFRIGSRPSATPDTATCHNVFRQEPGGVVVSVAKRDPVAACTSIWRESFNEPPPSRLITCVVDEGGTGVFPYPEDMEAGEACGSIGAADPAGP
jgi:hypothetical protein